MIIVLKQGIERQSLEELKTRLLEFNIDIIPIYGAEKTILGLVGDTSSISIEELEMEECVEKVIKVQEPFKKANRKFHPSNTIINIKNRTIGDDNLAIIAGPCSVESEEQIINIAKRVKSSGASFLRGGAFKPRTSPYSFQGLETEGLFLLKKAKEITGLPIVSEITNVFHIDSFMEYVDIIQVGARNMQNFEMLKELGKVDRPILLKRGFANTLQELLMSAEYIMSNGNENVILCERGIRTFENYTRNTLDLSAIPALKKMSHLPVVIDPSHATGHAWMIEPLAKASVAAGADGLIIEVHNDPKHALSDGEQSITPDAFDNIMKKLSKMAEIEGKTIKRVD
jgi:3-deoxy-7-phosphoheptulonate synthase